MEIKAIYPDGITEGVGTYVGTTKASPMTGTTTIQICGRVEPRGTWTLQPILKTWTDAAGKTYYDAINGTPSTFQVVGRATSSLSLKAKTKGTKVTAKSRLMREDGRQRRAGRRPAGRLPEEGRQVVEDLQDRHHLEHGRGEGQVQGAEEDPDPEQVRRRR